jgi:protein phosphatase
VATPGNSLVIGFETVEYASLTDVGVRRSHNQDAHSTLLANDEEQWHERGHIFLVADGMGAHAVGELASELAVSIIPHTYHKYAPQGAIPALRKAFIEANASIHAKGQQNPEFGGMGTTTTALLLRPEGAWIGHVGDSRTYRIRHGNIEQLSFDHSLLWEIARRQGVDPDTLPDIQKNVIVRSLGPEPLVQVDVEGPHPIRPGDIFVLCSDGLSGHLSDSEIGAIAGSLPAAEACQFLVDLANLRGGQDNITVLIVRVNSRPDDCQPKKVVQPRWYRRMPWPLTALVAGVLLVGIAAYLYHIAMRPVSIAVFIVAAAAIIGGLGGLVMTLAREKRRLADDPGFSKPKVYRQAPCQTERPLVEKLSKAVKNLKQQIKEKHWEMDWSAYQQHEDAAEALIGQEKLTEGFCEYCRGMRMLAETVQRYRPRGPEGFAPLWDKPDVSYKWDKSEVSDNPEGS